MDCGVIREAIPEVVSGIASAEVLAAVEHHASACPECADEWALVRVLHASRPEPRAELASRVLRGLSFDRQAVQRPWWALTAAAVAALALGIGVSSGRGIDVVAPAFAMELDEAWASEGLVAGGPVFDDLSDAALERLLDDLSDDLGVD
jgi:predicted anti-sigma-YlaC factor YlaD